MAKIGFTVSTPDGGGADLGDLLVPRDIFSEGGLWTWGDNSSGQMGDSTIVTRSSPVQTIAGGTNWKSVASGNSISCAAIKTDGSLWLWGDNINGQLGNSQIVNRSSPVQTIALGNNWKQVSAGSLHTAAIKTDGSLWTWGGNNIGQLGNSQTVNRSSPVQTIALGNNWKQVACGLSFCSAIKTDGTLWSWGTNTSGQLGDSTTGLGFSKSSPVQTIAGGTNWQQVSCGQSFSAAIKTDGSLWLWGDNSSGQLGNSQLVNTSSPVQTIAGGNNWKQVSGGGHTAAIKTDGSLWLWGSNAFGQLGDSTTTTRSSPVQTIASGNNWKQTNVNNSNTLAIKTDGTLWAWGAGVNAVVGDNTLTNRSSPVQTIAGGTNWKQVGGGQIHSIAVKDDM